MVAVAFATVVTGAGVWSILPAYGASSAASYGYPYPNAPDCDEITGANCIPDQWGFVQGQCHSWVAYRLNELNAAELSGEFNDTYRQQAGQEWGDAWHWGRAAAAAGITVDDAPALGSVAWWSGNGGHVGYVESVNADGSVTMSEMNADLHNGFDFATLVRGARWPDGFIHIADVPGSAPTSSSSSSSSTSSSSTSSSTSSSSTSSTTMSTTTTTSPAPTSTSAPAHVVPHPIPRATSPSSGYWLLGTDGTVYPFGGSRAFGNGGAASTAITARRDGRGYWTTNEWGHVAAYGAARRVGAPPRLGAGEAVRGIAATPSANGYWLFTSSGRVFAVGDASARVGDLHARRLAAPIMAAAATPSGRGYYMVGGDGGVFAFGDARFFGSTASLRLTRPIVGIVPTADGRGYWLVAADGGVFAFGDARFRGSMGGTALTRPVIGMVRYGNGYVMVASDGGVFDFSNRRFSGSLGGKSLRAPVVAIAAFG